MKTQIIAFRMDAASTGTDGKHHPFMFVVAVNMTTLTGRRIVGHRLTEDRTLATRFNANGTAIKAFMAKHFQHDQPVEIQNT